MTIKKKLLSGTAATFLLGLVGVWAVGSLLSRTTNGPVVMAPAPAQKVRFSASDGSMVTGTYWPGREMNAKGVLLLHGNGSSRATWNDMADLLVENGYAVLAIDFRGHGESSPAPRSFGYFEARDAHAAVEWFKAKQQGAPIAAVGSSLGGAAALIGEAGPLRVDALILVAVYPDIRTAIYNRLANRLGAGAAYLVEPMLSYQSYVRQGVSPDRLSPVKAAATLTMPVLVIGGEDDRSTPPSEIHALAAVIKEPSEWWIEPDVDHGALTAGQGSPLQQRMLQFLDAYFART